MSWRSSLLLSTVNDSAKILLVTECATDVSDQTGLMSTLTTSASPVTVQAGRIVVASCVDELKKSVKSTCMSLTNGLLAFSDLLAAAPFGPASVSAAC